MHFLCCNPALGQIFFLFIVGSFCSIRRHTLHNCFGYFLPVNGVCDLTTYGNFSSSWYLVSPLWICPSNSENTLYSTPKRIQSSHPNHHWQIAMPRKNKFQVVVPFWERIVTLYSVTICITWKHERIIFG